MGCGRNRKNEGTTIGIMTMRQACVSRERKNAGASGTRTSSRHAQATGTGGGTVPVATPYPTRGAGAAARPLRAGGARQRDVPHATDVTRRGWEGGTRDARATRPGGSRGATVASEARPLHRGASVQPGVTRRGWAGSGRTCSRAAGAAERRASIATRSRVMGGLWTEQKIITRHDKLLHQCR